MFSNPFDHIHGRDLTTCFKDHVPVFRSAFNALRPGGYFETQDATIRFRCIDDSVKGLAFERWQMRNKEATTALGGSFFFFFFFGKPFTTNRTLRKSGLPISLRAIHLSMAPGRKIHV